MSEIPSAAGVGETGGVKHLASGYHQRPPPRAVRELFVRSDAMVLPHRWTAGDRYFRTPLILCARQARRPWRSGGGSSAAALFGSSVTRVGLSTEAYRPVTDRAGWSTEMDQPAEGQRRWSPKSGICVWSRLSGSQTLMRWLIVLGWWQ